MAIKGLVQRCVIYSKAITDANRMKMLKIIGSSPAETVSVGDVANILGLSQSTVSKHLQILYSCGLLRRKKKGNMVFYSLEPEAVEDYKAAMTDAFEKVWTPCLYGYACEECPYSETCH